MADTNVCNYESSIAWYESWQSQILKCQASAMMNPQKDGIKADLDESTNGKHQFWKWKQHC